MSDINDLRDALKPQEAFLTYFIDTDEVTAFLVRPDGLRRIPLLVHPDDLKQQTKQPAWPTPATLDLPGGNLQERATHYQRRSQSLFCASRTWTATKVLKSRWARNPRPRTKGSPWGFCKNPLDTPKAARLYSLRTYKGAFYCGSVY